MMHYNVGVTSFVTDQKYRAEEEQKINQ